MGESERVECGRHGARRAAFVCRHVAGGSGLGFHEGDGPDLCAWCEECERVRLEHGGWDEESEKVAEIMLICEACFEEARRRNRLGTEG